MRDGRWRGACAVGGARRLCWDWVNRRNINGEWTRSGDDSDGERSSIYATQLEQRERSRANSTKPPPSIHDYEVASQSRTDLSFAPELLNIFRPENGWDTRQRAVAIDYPRSFWRIGGDPSAGCNRADGVASSFRCAPGARMTHSPLLDSRCSAFPSRFCKPVEFVLRSWLALLGGLAQLVVRFVARSIAPQSK